MYINEIFTQNICERVIIMISKTGSELPIGFAMELAMDLDAMDAFAEMSENDQQVWIDGARRMNTKDEMHHYVHSITNTKNNHR